MLGPITVGGDGLRNVVKSSFCHCSISEWILLKLVHSALCWRCQCEVSGGVADGTASTEVNTAY